MLSAASEDASEGACQMDSTISASNALTIMVIMEQPHGFDNSDDDMKNDFEVNSECAKARDCDSQILTNIRGQIPRRFDKSS